MFATLSAVRADDDCQKRTAQADHNLHEAIQKYGPQSSQAEHWRSELAAARSYCWGTSTNGGTKTPTLGTISKTGMTTTTMDTTTTTESS